MDNLIFAFNAISPIILLIALGYFLARIGFLKNEFLKNANKLVFKVALPCLLFINVYSIESFNEINFPFVLYCIGFVVIFFAVGLIIAKLFIPDEKQKGVIVQCVFRSNFAIIGLPLAESLGGVAAKGAAAVLSAFSIPTYNILAVIALSLWASSNNTEKKRSYKKMLKGIATNPLIVSVVLGVIVLVLRNFVTSFSLKNNLPFVYTTVKSLAELSTPLALIVLGGQFDFKTAKGNLRQITLGAVFRLIAVPTITLGLAVILSGKNSFFSFGPEVFPAMLALFATPVAVSSAIMAEQMDNDGRLADQLVVWTSLFSIITIYLFIVVLRVLGIL